MSEPIIRWRVSKYSAKPERHEFVGETAHFLITAKGRRTAKSSSWEWYHETEEAALAQIDEHRAAQDQRRADDLIRRVAPFMFSALQHIANTTTDERVREVAQAAIAKATGEGA